MQTTNLTDHDKACIELCVPLSQDESINDLIKKSIFLTCYQALMTDTEFRFNHDLIMVEATSHANQIIKKSPNNLDKITLCGIIIP